MTKRTYSSRRRPWGASLLALGLMVGVAGCDSLLDVENPNNIAGDDILNPTAASALANGALSGVARGYSEIMASYSTVTDELEWVGSRDAYQELDFGNPQNPFNEFVDAQYPELAQGNWMAREAVRVLTQHQADGNLADPTDLGRAELYLAISYIIIGDMFDDFVYSDRQDAQPPVGEANMGAQTYDLAIAALNTAISIAQSEGDTGLETAAMGFRARAEHGRAVWNKVGTRPIDTSNSGLVSAPAAATDAAAALALMGSDNYTWDFTYASSTVSNSLAGWVNLRQEMRFAQSYTSPDPTGNPTYDQVTLTDPIDVGTVSPILESTILGFTAGDNFPSMTLISAREMYLIMAEDALASGNTAGFATNINALRAIDGLTAWDQAAPQVPALDLLIHHRRTDLFLQGRRLADEYRFQDASAEWQPSSTAMTQPGTFFPITVIECRANPNIPDSC